MPRELSRSSRVRRSGLSMALILTFGFLSGCGGPQEGTLQEEQSEEITEANNAMLEYAQSEGKVQSP